jgi:hypothetical protein
MNAFFMSASSFQIADGTAPKEQRPEHAIAAGRRTCDIRAASDSPALSTSEMGQAIVTHILHP